MARKVLIATDGSDIANRALDCAAEFSNKLGRDLSIVHVLMHGRPPDEYARMAEVEGMVQHVASKGFLQGAGASVSLREQFERLEDEIAARQVVTALAEEVIARARQRAEEAGAHNITSHICAGDYADKILDIAQQEGADMIVLGRRGLGRVRETLLGSVSQKVLHHAPCTVVIAH